MDIIRWKTRPAYAVGVLATLTISAIVISTAFWLWDLRKRELAHASLEAVSVTRMFMEATEQSLDSTDVLLKSVQERLQHPYGRQLALDSAPIHLLLNTRVFGVRHLNSLFIVDANGIVVNSSREIPQTKLSVADRDYFKALAHQKDDTLYIDKPVMSRKSQEWTLHIARRFSDPDGNFKGAIVAGMNTPYIEDLYALLKLDYVRPVALYLIDGTLVASQPRRDTVLGQRAPEIVSMKLPVQRNEVVFGRHRNEKGLEESFALGRVYGFPFLISVTNEQGEALASWRETAIPIALGASLIILFIAAVATFLMKELVREEGLARALNEANERYHQTVVSMMDAIIAVDESFRVLLFNPAAEQMLGLKAQDVLGHALPASLPAQLHEIFRQLAQNAESELDLQPQIIGHRADGTEFPIESTVSYALIGGRPQLTAVLRDVTEQRRTEYQLREVNQQLRGLSVSLQEVREQERTRIAHELHDELGQQLTGLKLDLSWLSRRTKEDRPVSATKVDEMRGMLDVAIASVRRISTELRPPVLDDLGFGDAVAWQAREFAKRSDLAIELELEAARQVTDEATATALYRIVQESLTNIMRHAQASRVVIRLTAEDGQLVLCIHDDGKGVNLEQPSHGFGLVSMRERANALGGQFCITSQPGDGTRVEVTLPLDSTCIQEEAV
ncbi:PAS domain S-box protein [Uliginosibacterium gangwonense]|uniref:PAS domain S-box protein n=1 Tax=Uliginosibacterium gangwonense TaxID=392736 RepID=UPI0003664927|nr:PAS domain S-box protein [Uliginosibacterium gangwonense]